MKSPEDFTPPQGEEETKKESPVEPEAKIVDSTQDMLETGKKVFKFLERTKFLDLRKSDDQFNEWLEKLSFEDYTDYLTRLNGILREVPIKDRAISEAEGKTNEGSIGIGIIGYNFYLPPAAEQKEQLMKDGLKAVKQITDSEDRALLAYYTLNAIHPYSDGNGRTGRLLYEIISEGGKELTPEKLSELLDHDRKGHDGIGKGQDIFAEKVLEPSNAYSYINREVVREMFGEDFLNEYSEINIQAPSSVNFLPELLKKELPPREAILAEEILGEAGIKDFPFRGIILKQFLDGKTDRQKYQYEYPIDKGGIAEDMKKKSFSIDGVGLAESFTAEDIRQLIKIHEEVKTIFIKNMIDIFANPENHKMKTEEGEEVLIKSVFRK